LTLSQRNNTELTVFARCISTDLCFSAANKCGDRCCSQLLRVRTAHSLNNSLKGSTVLGNRPFRHRYTYR
jgi:hypothetical protein